jgi:O-antigen/teichoic acid export membrane protein
LAIFRVESARPYLNTFFRESVIYGLGGVLNRSIGLVLIPLYTRHLTVSEYGALAILGVSLQFLTFIGLMGVSSASMRFFFETGNDHQYPMAVYGNSTLFLLVWPPLVCLSIWGLLSTLNIQTIFGVKVFPYVAILLCTASTAPLITLVNGLLRVKKSALGFSVFNLALFIIQGAVIWCLVSMTGLGLFGQVIGQFFTHLVFCLVALAVLLKFAALRFDAGVLRRLLFFGAPLLPFFVFAWFNTALPRFVVEQKFDLEALGVFFLASQFAAIVAIFTNTFNNAFLPRFYSLASQERPQSKLSLLIEAYLALFAWIAIIISCTAPFFIDLLASTAFGKAKQIVPLLTLSYLLYAFASPIHWIMTHAQKTAELSRIRVLSTGSLALSLGVVLALDLMELQAIVFCMIFGNAVMLFQGVVACRGSVELKQGSSRIVWHLLFLLSVAILVNVMAVFQEATVRAMAVGVLLIISFWVSLKFFDLQEVFVSVFVNEST